MQTKNVNTMLGNVHGDEAQFNSPEKTLQLENYPQREAAITGWRSRKTC